MSIRERAYLEAIQSKHLRLLRSAVAERKGKEIMTIGDSFFLTFDEPLDGLRCCAAIQQRLADQPIDTLHGPLRLRLGLHVGTPEFFEGSWHGTDVTGNVAKVGDSYLITWFIAQIRIKYLPRRLI